MTGFARAEAGLEAQPSVAPVALNGAEVAAASGRVAVFNRDLWAMRGRIAAATGLTPVPALVSAVGCEAVAVWGAGRSWTAAAACGAGARMIHLEDAFLRSPSPGRGAESVGLIVDPVGPDPARSPRLARLIDERAALPDQTDGAAALALLRELKLSKYMPPPAPMPPIPRGAVCIADQAPGDAALPRAAPAAFAAMLLHALEAHPNAPVLIRPHPAAAEGHLGPTRLLQLARTHPRVAGALRRGRLRLLPPGIPPHALFSRLSRLHVATSLLGLEALIHGVPVTCHAPGFYSGRGLTRDVFEGGQLRRAPLSAIIAAAYLDHCTWFEPGGDRPVPFHRAAEALRRLADRGPPPPRRRPSQAGFVAAVAASALRPAT